jgi:uncharacterized damage-inducible protein DinB
MVHFYIAFCSPFVPLVLYAFLATQEVARMDFHKELIAEYDREIATTRKIFAAIPADVDFAYKPHPKSFTLGRLAGHTAETAGEWALTTFTTDKLEFGCEHVFERWVPASVEELLARFDKETAEAKAALAAFAPEKWDENWKFVAGGQAWIDDTKYHVFRNWVLDHLIHHRAQLGVYLRLLNAPIPGTYGPSADET